MSAYDPKQQEAVDRRVPPLPQRVSNLVKLRGRQVRRRGAGAAMARAMVIAHRFGHLRSSFLCLGIHAWPHLFIGHMLDTRKLVLDNLLILLALPRGLEPLFSP